MTIVNLREDVARAIENAKLDLDKALAELDRIPTLDPSAVGFVAHAMSNYLHVSEAVLGMLKGALANHPDPEVATWLDGLHHVSEMAQQTVGRLLTAYEPGQMPMKFEYVRLERLIERACTYHSPSAKVKDVQIICRFPDNLPEVWGDRVAIAVIADNLLSNAVKFSSAGDHIDVALEARPGGVECSVRDHGPGLTPLTQARIFERGEVPGHPAPASDHPTGYGLLVAKAFVERMNGRLWSESEPGKGASFEFWIPYQPPQGYGPR